MAAESTLTQNLDSRNRGETEPRKKLRKKRSIRVSSRGSYLRQSSKPSKSRLDSLSLDESSEISSLQEPNLVALSDSLQNNMKLTSSFSAKKESCQEFSENDDDMNSVISSSCGSSDRVQCQSTNMSDGSPKSLNAIRHQASSHDSESSDDSSDHSKTPDYVQSKTSYSGKKSLQPLSRSSSRKAVKILFKKSSFKPNRNPLKYSQMSEESAVERATCSSKIKNSRFPDQVELEPGQSESETISFFKVCPYHHCSLHGHCHNPPPQKKPFLRRKRQSSIIPQSSVRSSSGTGHGKEFSVDKKKEAKKQPMTSSGKERTLGCHRKGTKEKKSSASRFASGGGQETTASFGDIEKNISPDGDNDVSSHNQPLKYARTPHDQVSISGDNNSDRKSSKINTSWITHNLLSSKMDEAKEETNSNQKLTGDSENREQGPNRDSKPAVSFGVRESRFGKRGNMSMWHLIHKHMASGLAAEGGMKPLQGADEGRKVDEADMTTAGRSSNVSLDFSDSDMGTYNQEEENQDIEIRKLYAIKLVREAIEKILLPEVQDQLSENQSVTSDIVEDQEFSEKNHQEGPDEISRSDDGNIGGSENMSSNPRVPVQVDDSTSEQEMKKSEPKLEKKSDKKSPSNWSNLKKWILLQRFTKELEKVRKLNFRKPRQLQLDTDPGTAKISLRRQTVDEKKRAEEWMLDYALQQVVSQLAPTQKRKVSLLVKAFETVVPPQEDPNIQAQDNVKLTPDDSGRSSNSELSSGDAIPSPKKSEEPLNTSHSIILDQIEETATMENFGSSSVEQKATFLKETKRESQPEPVVVQIFPPMDSPSNHKDNETGQILLDKQNYLSMWHLVCQHVVSSVATKVGIELLGEEDEETEDVNKVSRLDNSGPLKDPPEGSHKIAKDIHVASHRQAEFSRSEVLKLVKEAVQEILSPEIQDDSSDTLSVSSEIVPEKELNSEKDHSEDAKHRLLNSTGLTGQSTRKFERSEDGLSENEEKETKENAITGQDSVKVESLDKSNSDSDPPKLKNWSKLKKLILLKRSIKAMERARKLKSQPQQQLPLKSDVEPEKVDLKHQMMDERRKAEQWMLDYAVQHIVTKLTPARKRRVAMLVEAFEAVVPLPES